MRAVRAACGLHAVLLADRDACVSVRTPNPWLHTSSESPLDNEAEIKGERTEERQTRGRKETERERERIHKRERMRGRETDGEKKCVKKRKRKFGKTSCEMQARQK